MMAESLSCSLEDSEEVDADTDVLHANDMIALPKDRMPEAEVALRFAIWLLSFSGAEPYAEAGIDGSAARVFPVRAFLEEEGWRCVRAGGRNGTSLYQGTYANEAQTIEVHARPGVGDVVASVDGQRVFGECKGGPLSRSSEGKERARLVAAVGQLVCARLPAEVLPVAAVPDTPEFRRLAGRMSEGTMAAEAGIRIALVGQNTSVEGLW